MSVTTVDATVIRPANENDGTANKPEKAGKKHKIPLTPKQRRLKWMARGYFAGVLAFAGFMTFFGAKGSGSAAAFVWVPALVLGGIRFAGLYMIHDLSHPEGKPAMMTRKQTRTMGRLLLKQANFLALVYGLAFVTLLLSVMLDLPDQAGMIAACAFIAVPVSFVVSIFRLCLQMQGNGLGAFVDYSGSPGGSDGFSHSGDSSCSIYSDSTYRNVPGNIYHVY